MARKRAGPASSHNALELELEPTSAPTLRAKADVRSKRRTSSRFIGVCWYAAYRAWSATVATKGKKYFVGYFDDERRAATERDNVALAVLGAEARLNFHPRTGQEVHGCRAKELGLRARPRSAQAIETVLERAARFRRPRRVTHRTGITGYHGVLVAATGKFAATVHPEGGPKNVRAGTWNSAKAAALARDRAVLHFGLDVPLNFPSQASKLGPASPWALRQLTLRAAKGSKGRPPLTGVSRHPKGYRVQICLAGRTRFLGRFDTLEAAGLCYDRAAVHYHGPDAPRNFPKRRVQPASVEELRHENLERWRNSNDRRGLRTSRYSGIVASAGKKWAAVVPVKGKYLRAGTWSSERAAVIARDRAVLYYQLPLELHFPKRSRRLGAASAPELRLAAQSTSRTARRLSGYTGVSCVKGRWKAQLRVGGVSHTLGRFESAEEAALVRERALVFHGARALRNFPGRPVKPASIEEIQRESALLRKEQRGTSSRYFGVVFSPDSVMDRPWAAQFQLGGSSEPLGFWESEEQAAEAFDRALCFYKGPKRLFNFPDRDLEPADAESLRVEARQTFFKSRTWSRFRGVTWASDRKAWLAFIRYKNRAMKLGYFDDERDAARAYDRKSIELRGERAWLNFHPRTGVELYGKRIELVDGKAYGSAKSREPARGTKSGRPPKRRAERGGARKPRVR